MNNVSYIEKLKAENVILKNGIKEMRGYVSSPKFSVVRNVYVNDILLRIEETETALSAIENMNRETLKAYIKLFD